MKKKTEDGPSKEDLVEALRKAEFMAEYWRCMGGWCSKEGIAAIAALGGVRPVFRSRISTRPAGRRA